MTKTSYATDQRESARADIYRLLSACYYEPEDSFLEEDVFGQMAEALMRYETENANIAERMETAFREAGSEPLLLDYTRLFLGPLGIRAKPYGSVYLEGENVIMGDSTVAVQERYHEGGFKLEKTFIEVPDHVAAELEFLYLLSAQLGNSETTADRYEELVRLKHRFLREHLGLWVTPFTNAMENGAETEFYRLVATLTRDIVIEDLREKNGAASL